MFTLSTSPKLELIFMAFYDVAVVVILKFNHFKV